MAGRLEGKVALITGAARGQGEAEFGKLDIRINNAGLSAGRAIYGFPHG